MQPLGLETGQDEGIDRVADPAAVLHRRYGWVYHRLVRPLAPRGGDRPGRSGTRSGRSRAGTRPPAGVPQGNPSLTHRVRIDCSPGGQLAPGRHLQLLVADRLEQQALLGPVDDDGGSQLSALQDGRAAVEPEAALDLLARAVALEAPRLEDRPDLLFIKRTCSAVNGGDAPRDLDSRYPRDREQCDRLQDHRGEDSRFSATDDTSYRPTLLVR